MTKKIDDFEATRLVVETLSSFEPKDQERIIRWACEKLGLASPSSQAAPEQRKPSVAPATEDSPASASEQRPRSMDIKTFVGEKRPNSDMQFAAAIAYYYAFEAPEANRRASVSSADLKAACRLIGRERLQNPGQTLRNAHFNGLLDKAEQRGTYKINTVGENLVAVTLPGDGNTTSPRQKRKSPASKKKPNAKIKAKKKQ